MIRHHTLACAAAFFLTTLANGQGAGGPQDADLSPLARESLEGNWVRISEQPPEKLASSIAAFCNARMFVKGDLAMDWKFDTDKFAAISPVLGDAKSNLAFHFNAPDDLFIAQTPKTLFPARTLRLCARPS